MCETVINRISDRLTVAELKNGLRLGTDAILLSSFCRGGVNGCDLGTGNGIISFLLLSAGKAERMTGIELMREYADLCRFNSETNGFGDRFTLVTGGVEQVSSGLLSCGHFDFAVSNPPYLKAGSGKPSEDRLRNAAFHETTADIDAFCACAAYILKPGGSFFCVYRYSAENLARLICAMEKAGIPPVRIREVCPSENRQPSLVLAEGIKGAEVASPKRERPLYIYSDPSHSTYSAETEAIYRDIV